VGAVRRLARPGAAHALLFQVCCMYVQAGYLYKQQVPDGQRPSFTLTSQPGKATRVCPAAMEDHDSCMCGARRRRCSRRMATHVCVDTLTGCRWRSRPTWWCWLLRRARADARELGQRLRSAPDEHGFFSEAHPSSAGGEPDGGVFLAGAASSPRTSRTVAQASGARPRCCASSRRRRWSRSRPSPTWTRDLLRLRAVHPGLPYEGAAMHDWRISPWSTPPCARLCGVHDGLPQQGLQLRN